MKISIVTAVMNNAAQIEETMLSVLSQDYPDVEYIVIDGASTDGTLDIIRRYSDRLTAVVSEPDGGIYQAMNKGIRRATGDIVGIINSGDWYYPGAFRRVVSSFAGKPLDNSIFWGDVMYERLGRVKGFRPLKVKIGAFAPHPSMFVPRQVYERIGMYDESFRLLGDYDFMYRAVNRFGVEVIYLPELIAFYREGGLSDRRVAECLRDELRVKIRYGQPVVLAWMIYILKYLRNYRRICANRAARNR